MAHEQSMIVNINKGACYVLFAFDVGRWIDLDEAERRITAIKQRTGIKYKRRAPPFFDYRPAPLRVTEESSPLTIGQRQTSPSVELLLYDFAAVSVTYSIQLNGTFCDLRDFGQGLSDSEEFVADSKRRVEDLLAGIVGTVEQPRIAASVASYAIFLIEDSTPPLYSEDRLVAPAHTIAQLLRSETRRLAEQEIRDATELRISFGPNDVAIIDGKAALIFGQEMDDVRAILEFANVELLEMRCLDQKLDLALDHAYEVLSKRRWAGVALPGMLRADLRRIARMQVDSAILFERVSNTLKLIGDQYLTRVYRLAARRFYLKSWDANIMRKLQTLDSIYGKITDTAATRRMEVLEWIIIVLLTVSVAASFLPGFGSH